MSRHLPPYLRLVSGAADQNRGAAPAALWTDAADAFYAVDHGDTAKSIVDAAMSAVAEEMAAQGLEGGLGEADALRDALHDMVVRKLRETVLNRILEIREDPELAAWWSTATRRERLIYLLTDGGRD